MWTALPCMGLAFFFVYHTVALLGASGLYQQVCRAGRGRKPASYDGPGDWSADADRWRHAATHLMGQPSSTIKWLEIDLHRTPDGGWAATRFDVGWGCCVAVAAMMMPGVVVLVASVRWPATHGAAFGVVEFAMIGVGLLAIVWAVLAALTVMDRRGAQRSPELRWWPDARVLELRQAARRVPATAIEAVLVCERSLYGDETRRVRQLAVQAVGDAGDRYVMPVGVTVSDDTSARACSDFAAALGVPVWPVEPDC